MGEIITIIVGGVFQLDKNNLVEHPEIQHYLDEGFKVKSFQMLDTKRGIAITMLLYKD